MAAPFLPPAMPPIKAPAPTPPAVVSLSRCLAQKLLPCLCPSPTQAECVWVVLLCRCRSLPQVLADVGTDSSAINANTINRESTFLIWLFLSNLVSLRERDSFWGQVGRILLLQLLFVEPASGPRSQNKTTMPFQDRGNPGLLCVLTIQKGQNQQWHRHRQNLPSFAPQTMRLPVRAALTTCFISTTSTPCADSRSRVPNPTSL